MASAQVTGDRQPHDKPDDLNHSSLAQHSISGDLTIGPARLPSQRSRFTFRGLGFDRNRVVSPAQESDDAWGPLGLHLLHCPSDPLIDFVFVHGLRGGSVKTWCKNEDRGLYWPEAWLPHDPDLRNLRIHSFGYNSDWGESKETCLDLHDFGRSLLGELVTCPELRKGPKTPIFLIGHSMGGLVIKKAYLLARQDEKYHEIANRIQCMFFLATPHRGSDSAKLLNNVLRASPFHNPKQYVTDIARNSAALSVINDEFHILGDEVNIWSFYETVKTRVGTNSIMIVERDSAVIGHRRENIHPINADHRGICKFESPSDPNYVCIRNALLKATQDVLEPALNLQRRASRDQLIELKTYLHVTHDPEDDLDVVESKKATGSCKWVTSLPIFASWSEDEASPFSCFWLSGQPGAGKSVVAGHVIRHLQKLGMDTSYFFFRHGQKSKQTASSLLSSLAFQMASLDPTLCGPLLEILRSTTSLDQDDERGIWRKIFLRGIFTVPIANRQYWIIDALDECVDYTNLVSLLHHFDCCFQIRVLLVSRRLPELERNLVRLNSRLRWYPMTTEDTRGDIQQFVWNHSDDIPVDSEDKSALIKQLVEKSNGSFLWTELALGELGKVFSEDEIHETLEQVPAGMTAMYDRILETMANNGRQIKLIKAIIEWVACGTRPLHVDELQAALALDLKTKIRNIDRAVGELCGQLFFVDQRGLVQLLHATTREFLLGDECISPFRVERAVVNRRLALVCLEYLTSDEMRPPRHPALVGKYVGRSNFADYAVTACFDHLAAAFPCEEITAVLDKFFRTNVLSWIESVLTYDSNLHHLIQASQSVGMYVDAVVERSPGISEQRKTFRTWQMDLSRVALKFGHILKHHPSCIHFVVPPLCPEKSNIGRQFAADSPGLKLNGLIFDAWDDCICNIDYGNSYATSIVAADGIFGIGLRSGMIKIYSQATCQEILSVNHGERPRLIRLDGSLQYLASSGRGKLRMWSLDGNLLWEIKTEADSVAMAFSDANCALKTIDTSGRIAMWDVKLGTAASATNSGTNAERARLGKRVQIINHADISPDGELAIIDQRGHPPEIWSIQRGVMIGTCHRTRDRPGVPIMSVFNILFNPHPSMELLAVSYSDGDLAIFHTWHGGDEIKVVDAAPSALAATPDGQKLATEEGAGYIRIWSFGTLTLLYTIDLGGSDVRRMAFSGDGLRLYGDAYGQAKVWEPPLLDIETIAMDSVITESKPTAVGSPPDGQQSGFVAIGQLLSPDGTGVVFVGKDDGSVSAYNPVSGMKISSLYSHRRNMFVTEIAWNHDLIASQDNTNTVLVYKLTKTSTESCATGDKVFEHRFESIDLHHIHLHPNKPWLLVTPLEFWVNPEVFDVTRNTKLFDITTQADLPSQPGSPHHFRSWAWLCRTTENEPEVLLLGARDTEVDIYRIDAPTEATATPAIVEPMTVLQLQGPGGSPLSTSIQHIMADHGGNYLVVTTEKRADQWSGPLSHEVSIYNSQDLFSAARSSANDLSRHETGSRKIPVISHGPIIHIPGHEIKFFLGFYGPHRLVFLDHDLWVRSIDMSKLGLGPSHDLGNLDIRPDLSTGVNKHMVEYVPERHFFVPHEIVETEVRPIVTPDHGTVIFCKEDKLAVISNGLDMVSPVGKRQGGGSGSRGICVETNQHDTIIR